MNHEKNELIDLSFDALSERGNLAKAITNFNVRGEQQKMAAAVAEAISAQHDLVCEAGTGIGKNFCLFGTCFAIQKAHHSIHCNTPSARPDLFQGFASGYRRAGY